MPIIEMPCRHHIFIDRAKTILISLVAAHHNAQWRILYKISVRLHLKVQIYWEILI